MLYYCFIVQKWSHVCFQQILTSYNADCLHYFRSQNNFEQGFKSDCKWTVPISNPLLLSSRFTSWITFYENLSAKQALVPEMFVLTAMYLHFRNLSHKMAKFLDFIGFPSTLNYLNPFHSLLAACRLQSISIQIKAMFDCITICLWPNTWFERPKAFFGTKRNVASFISVKGFCMHAYISEHIFKEI